MQVLGVGERENDLQGKGGKVRADSSGHLRRSCSGGWGPRALVLLLPLRSCVGTTSQFSSNNNESLSNPHDSKNKEKKK